MKNYIRAERGNRFLGTWLIMYTARHILFLVLFLSAAIFSGCKKNDPDSQSQNTTNPPLAHAQIVHVGDSTNSNQFEYDAASKLTKLIIVSNSNAYAYNITYQNGVPAKLQAPSFTTDLIYTNGLLTKTQVHDNNSPLVQGVTLFNYINGNLSEQLFYERVPETDTLEHWLKYKIESLPGGDIRKIQFFLWDRTIGAYNYLGSDEFEYDTHPNPVYQVKDLVNLFNFPATPHNVKKENTFDISGFLIGTIVYDYTYDSAGYPEKAKSTNEPIGGVKKVSTVTYRYR